MITADGVKCKQFCFLSYFPDLVAFVIQLNFYNLWHCLVFISKNPTRHIHQFRNKAIVVAKKDTIASVLLLFEVKGPYITNVVSHASIVASI